MNARTNTGVPASSLVSSETLLDSGPEGAAFLIHPTPVGVGTVAVESLSGYLQRLATLNMIPLTALVTAAGGFGANAVSGYPLSTLAQSCDLYPGDLSKLACLVRQPLSALEALTVLPVYRAFYGEVPPNSHAIRKFFHPSRSEATVTLYRRICPACVQESGVYRLVWQFVEVQVCLTHGCFLEDKCARCYRRSRILPARAVVGRCYQCRTSLTESVPRKAPKTLLAEQTVIQADYEALLCGQLRFSPPLQVVSEEAGDYVWTRWGGPLKDRQGRMETRSHIDTAVSVPPIMAWRKGEPLTFSRLLYRARSASGSLRAFAALFPSRGHGSAHAIPPVQAAPCLNRWCRTYRTINSIAVDRKGRSLCVACGCRVLYHPKRLFGLPTEQFFMALFRFYQYLLKGQPWRQALVSAGLPLGKGRQIMKRLAGLELVRPVGCGWMPRALHYRKWNRYPLTPTLMFQTPSERRTNRYAEFRESVRESISVRLYRGERVTLANIATDLYIQDQQLQDQMRRCILGLWSD